MSWFRWRFNQETGVCSAAGSLLRRAVAEHERMVHEIKPLREGPL